MIEFHLDAFTLGECREQIHKTPVTTVAVLDDFWNDFEAVQEQIEKLPFCKTAYHTEDMEDYRFGFVKTIAGHDMPFRNELVNKISTLFSDDDILKKSMKIDLAFNINSVGSDRIKSDFYNPHLDAGFYTVVVFMNNEYDDSDGFNIYRPSRLRGLWRSRDQVRVDTFVRGKPNRAVVFPAPGVLHGLEIRSDNFREEYRCTSALFLNHNV